MKQSVKIATIIICSLIIILACVGFVFSLLGCVQFEALKDFYAQNEQNWLDTEDYEYCKLIYSALLMQIVVEFAVILFSLSLLFSVLGWKSLNDAINTPEFFLSSIMTKRTLKLHIPMGIVGVITCITLYLILQFVIISADWIWLFAIVLLLMGIVSCVLLFITLSALIWKNKQTKNK